MLTAENLTFQLKNGRKILEEVSFTLGAGELCAVIGPNGAGKSTLMKITCGIHKPTAGEVTVRNKKISGMKRPEIARHIAYLPQFTHAVPCSVYDSVLLGRKPHISWHPAQHDRDITDSVMEDMGIACMREKCVTELSGGEFQKTLIARALVQQAEILMLDEPINHLDVKNQLDIMDTVSEITKRGRLATLVVMHDLNLAMRYADTVMLMNDGKIIYHGCRDGLTDEALTEAYRTDISIRQVEGKYAVIF
ncbi:ABC transporter ATP-binding protein [Seleniivibrio woodruffii]|uniref:ABC transporter ATP-binding protein n=1 Tax=Seleniivibrio woodruffii TaxID=1078050 RepID=UPI0026ED03B7|nr:ABC transporter ATP-binding protein [Seleniivibrio woodruffii]